MTCHIADGKCVKIILISLPHIAGQRIIPKQTIQNDPFVMMVNAF
jgi:hypothetical protein